MRTEGTTIIVFEKADIEWMAVFLIAYMLRNKERDSEGANIGSPVDQRLAAERLKGSRADFTEARYQQNPKLLGIVCKALGTIKIDLEREEFVGKRHIIRNLIANSYLKRYLDANCQSLDKHLTELQQKLLKFVPSKLPKNLLTEVLAEYGAKTLVAIFKNNNPIEKGVEFADGDLNLVMEPEIAAPKVASLNANRAPEPAGSGFMEGLMNAFSNARVTSYNPKTGVHSRLKVGESITEGLSVERLVKAGLDDLLGKEF